MDLRLLSEASDYLCDNTYREVIDEMKQLPKQKLVGLYNEFLSTPVPQHLRLSDLTPEMITLGLLSSALFETRIDTTAIRGNAVGGLGVIITQDNDVAGYDFHKFQMAYATFENGTGHRTEFNGRSGHELLALGTALDNSKFYDQSGTLVRIAMDASNVTISGRPLTLWGADFGDKVVRRYL